MLRGSIVNNSGREVKNTEGVIDEVRVFYVWSDQWVCALYESGRLSIGYGLYNDQNLIVGETIAKAQSVVVS